MLTPVEYYKSPEVQERIAEYCGGSAQEPELCTAEYLVGYGEALLGSPAPEPYVSTPKSGFHSILERGLDIFRSLWDRVALIALLDMEYFNLDSPGEVYRDANAVFKRLEPIYRSIREVYEDYEILPRDIITGQGYHFTFQIQAGSKTVLMLEELGSLTESLAEKYQKVSSKRHRPLSLRLGRSFHGLGLVMEYLTHEIMRRAGGVTDLPLVITDVAVGGGGKPRDAVSFDLSCFGDPLSMRDLRCPFSTHQKHKIQRYKVGDAIADGTPIQVAVPRGKLSLEDTLALRRHFRNSAEYAKEVYCLIPDFTVNFKKIIEEYQGSELCRFHRWYYGEKEDPRADWSRTYGAFVLSTLPPCVRLPLEKPNDLLLKPTNLQTLTRCLLARNWHPRHIAGLVHSRWTGPYGWDPDHWKNFDAGSRSDFYVRIFAGLMAAGLDEQVSQNCVSHREKGYCVEPGCGYNLADYRWDVNF